MAKVTQGSHKDRQYWLLKSDADTFSWDDCWNSPNRTTHWDGVRNFQARNYMRDEIKKGDLAFFYHSGGDSPGIVGIAEVVREGYPDSTATDPKDPHFDPRSKGGQSQWSMVDIRAVEKMPLLQKGNRLSVQKVGPAEWNAVVALSKENAGEP